MLYYLVFNICSLKEKIKYFYKNKIKKDENRR